MNRMLHNINAVIYTRIIINIKQSDIKLKLIFMSQFKTIHNYIQQLKKQYVQFIIYFIILFHLDQNGRISKTSY